MSTVRETYGLVCPKCGTDTDIVLEATTWIIVNATLLRKAKWAYFEWYLDSPCRCGNCKHHGSVGAFTVEDGGAS
jgi:hypothetical protein